MFRSKLFGVFAIIVPVLLGGCSALGSRDTPAPVEEAGETNQQAPRPVPATRIAPLPPPQQGSALKKLRLAALTQQRAGQYTQSAATLERAIRISPKDAALWQQLAQVRLRQKKWRLAINMAAKSNALAVGQASLQRKNWLMTAEAYRALGLNSKANAAAQRAR